MLTRYLLFSPLQSHNDEHTEDIREGKKKRGAGAIFVRLRIGEGHPSIKQKKIEIKTYARRVYPNKRHVGIFFFTVARVADGHVFLFGSKHHGLKSRKVFFIFFGNTKKRTYSSSSTFVIFSISGEREEKKMRDEADGESVTPAL